MFKKIAPDKWKHFYVGILMGAMLQAIAIWLVPQHLATASFAVFVLVVSISYGFELYSKITRHGHYEIADAIASIVGGSVGMAIAIAVEFAL